MKPLGKNKRGQLAKETIVSIVMLVVTLIVSFVLVSQINGAGLLGGNGTAEQNATDNLIRNLTTGVGEISDDVVTYFTIISAVIILGFVFFLWKRFQGMGLGSSGGSL